MTPVVFEDPKPKGTRRWEARLAPLKRRPGEWARVHVSPSYEGARSYAWSLQSGRYALPEGRFEFHFGQHEDGKGAVYARYVGEDA